MSSRKQEQIAASPSKAPDNWTSRDQGQLYDADLAQVSGGTDHKSLSIMKLVDAATPKLFL
jgi:type VI protein secretion system component Hcp